MQDVNGVRTPNGDEFEDELLKEHPLPPKHESSENPSPLTYAFPCAVVWWKYLANFPSCADRDASTVPDQAYNRICNTGDIVMIESEVASAGADPSPFWGSKSPILGALDALENGFCHPQ
ncbi:hypothetical protein PsorP6_011852 [Peronosclerospora sorghi]|uniref:Uncharacterized protein n=1 Tax=Peronosclerospora sorghi TaxID=230839 RepID=A0ACC0WM10_9STRA|nr:hypothetical protein PsorP6_011852 [Peronosclerospora sorghi]